MAAVLRKMVWSKLLFGFFVISVAWSISLFIAPLTIAPGTAVGLDGWANRVDNADVYTSFPLYARIIYTLGDAQCHQMAARTIWLNGNQMPIDARMTSIYVFVNLGLLSAMFSRPYQNVSVAIANLFPKRFREFMLRRVSYDAFAILMLLVFVAPVAVDGFTQLFSDFTGYESDNLRRVLTGIPAGWISGALIGVMMMSIKQVDLERRAPAKATKVPLLK